MHGHAVMGEQGVQKGAEHALLTDQLGAVCQEVQDPIAQGGVET